jgi:hypothetical protein
MGDRVVSRSSQAETITMSLSISPQSLWAFVPSRLRVLMVPHSFLLTLLLTATVLVFLFSSGEQAHGALSTASVIEGPNPDILDVDGAAMAPDGTGGLLYRKLIGGEPHLFASRFAGGAWQPPTRVDIEGIYGASFATIAAADDGRLLVVWAEPWAVIGQTTHYRLMSSELSPGAAGFSPAIPIDDLGDGTAAYPSLAMAPNGVAYVVYRVVTNPLIGNNSIVPLRTGDELIDVRVARYNGQGLPWSLLGAVNDHPELTMRQPSASNTPAIGVGLTGNAVVVWQEPDISGTARIFTRRIFGTRLGNVLQVSPDEVAGRPITVDADAPAVAVNAYGEARIAYRLSGGPGSPNGMAEMLLSTLPAETDPKGGQLEGSSVVGEASILGMPSVSVDGTGAMRLSYVGSETTTMVSADFKGIAAPVALGRASGSDAKTTIDPAGGGVTVWSATNTAGAPIVKAREEFGDGGWQLAQLSAPISGPVGEPVLGGSGQGDALIAFRQGPATQPQVMAAVAKAPPGEFLADTAIGWVKSTSARVSWTSPSEAYGATSYALVVDGQIRANGLTGHSTRIDPRSLGDGVHHIQILATDSLGQQTMTPPAELKVDADPPKLSITTLAHDTVRVRVYDRASGAVGSATSIEFGDGARVSDKLSARHTYTRPGLYVIVVRSRDKVGNRLLARVPVRVR